MQKKAERQELNKNSSSLNGTDKAQENTEPNTN